MASGGSGVGTAPTAVKTKTIETILPNGLKTTTVLRSGDGGQHWTATSNTSTVPGNSIAKTFLGAFNVIDWIVENWQLALLGLVCLLIATR